MATNEQRARAEGFKKRLGARVREIRKRKGFSQMDMVKQADWTLSHLQKIESGRLDPRFTTLVKLADDLDVSLSVLTRGF